MAYSIVGLLAIVIHLIINIGVFIDMKNGRKFRGEMIYFFFLLSAIIFHITDAIWGFIYDAKLVTALKIDTSIYMIAMASSILLWAYFVFYYVGLNKTEKKVIITLTFSIFAFQILTVIVNFFYPVLFSVSADCEYKAEAFRYANLSLQILTYLLVSTYMFLSARKQKGSDKRRHLSIASFGIFMIIAITLQVFFPLLPMYSLGYLLGICALHAFVFRDLLTVREEDLSVAKQQVLIDPLTGVYSKHAYIDAEEEIEQKINDNSMGNFAMVVFDLNDLKMVNDTYGHEAGDNYLRDSTKLIREFYKDIPIYRVGGDEFVAILLDKDYEKKDSLFKSFNEKIEQNLKNKDRLVISSGISTYKSGVDTTILKVFTRADQRMYDRKQKLKELELNK